MESVTFYEGQADYDSEGNINNNGADVVKEPVSFKGKELQVIVKIVEYILQPQQTYEGVWHAEGMSHENIVMTGG